MVITMSPQGSMLNDKVACPADEPSFNMFVGPYYTAAGNQFVGIGTGYVKVFTRRDCPAPVDNGNVCPAVEAFAKDPSTGVCCEYPDPCHAPKGWVTFNTAADCQKPAF
jgi:hypothetical protein